MTNTPADTQSAAEPVPGSPPTISSPPRFSLSKILLGIGCVAVIAVAVGSIRAISQSGNGSGVSAGNHSAIQNAYSVGQAIGAVVGLVLWPLLAGWLAFRVFGRSNKAANAAFLCVLLLCLAAHTLRRGATQPRPPQQSQSPASLAEIRAITEEARKASLDGDDERAIELTAESARKLKAAAANSTGSDKIVMEYAAALAKAQNELLKTYIDTAGAYTDDGGAALEGLDDPARLDKRIARLSDAISAHDPVVDYFGAIEANIPKELAQRGAKQEDIDQFLMGFTEKANLVNLLAIHRLEHAMLLASHARFELLRANAGKWSVSDKGSLIEAPGFSPEDLAEFNRLGTEVESLAEKQAALIEQRKAGT